MKKIVLTLILSSSLLTLCKAQFTILHSFNDTAGGNPWGNLTLLQNKFYGMAYQGGAHGQGCIFSVDTNGSGYKDLLDFNGANGANPKGSLIISGHTMYGMTSAGGSNNEGCVFSIDTNASRYTDLLDFNGVNGNQPWGSLTLAGNKLYGMTSAGGTRLDGNVFTIDTNGGGYKDLLDFNDTNGGSPFGSLLLNGRKLYGMTYKGGIHDSGCVFSIDTNTGGGVGSYKDLYNFTNTKGYYPHGDLILSGEKLYGMTWIGGANDNGVIFSLDTNGGNSYKDIVDFNYNTSGSQPQGSLTLSGGALYGMTFDGGVSHDGVLFSVDTNGNRFRDLFNFNNPQGDLAYGTLVFSGPKVYGMTSAGGAYSDGVIFACDTFSSPASINMLKAIAGNVKVYPNPSNGMFHIVCHSERSEVSQPQMKVYNVLGEQVLTETLRSTQGDNTIDLSYQPNGVYLYRVIANNGELIGEGKLIIQK